MKLVQVGVLAVVLLAGCAFNRYQSDIAGNQYHEKQIHADPTATYVGEWTAVTNIGLRSIKIKQDGRIKVCLPSSAGTTEGKVYLENGMPAIIIMTGAKVKFISVAKDFLLLEIYGKEEKYYAGPVPDPCRSAFINFD